MTLRKFLVPSSSLLAFLFTLHASPFARDLWAAGPKIVVDAGHGGTDPGATAGGLKEADINLDVSKRYRELLNLDTEDGRGGGEWQVSMTRETDVFVSLSSRTDYANSIGADRFLSIHTNSFSDPAANGISTFSYSEGTTGARLRNDIHAEAMKHWPLRDRGNQTANFHVLRETAMPAELHELAFISNAKDFPYLNDPSQRQEAARAHLHGLQNHYGQADYDPSGNPPPPPPPDDPPAPPPPSTGILTGLIYDSSLGTSARVSNAVVTLSTGASANADLNGVYTFSLSPAEYTVTATATGYQSAGATRTVVAGQTTWGSIGLAKIEDPPPPPPPPPATDTEAPTVTIAFPADGWVTNQPDVAVSGEVTDNLSVTKLAVNGVESMLSDGRTFSASVKLQPGSNKITVEAWDAAGNKGSASTTATFNLLSGDPGTSPPPADSPGCSSVPLANPFWNPSGLLSLLLPLFLFLNRRRQSLRK